MTNHFVIIVLLASVGTRCLVAQPCARLYIQGLHGTNYPQLAGVYLLKTSSPSEMKNDFPVYQHELDTMNSLFLYYNSSEAALMISARDSNVLLRVEKQPGVEISLDVNYSVDYLFNFFSWRQWDPVHNEFIEVVTDSVIKPICVDENFAFCTGDILYPNVRDGVGVQTVKVLVPGDEPSHTMLDIRKIHFRLRRGLFYDSRPVYEMLSNVRTVPYYLYHQNGKWRVGPEIGSISEPSEIVLETESDVMRVEYEQKSQWYAVHGYGLMTVLKKSALHHLQCHLGSSRHSARPPSLAGVYCRSASGDICRNGGSCHIDSDGILSCSCTPDFRGIYCKEPVSRCEQKLPSGSASFVLSDREGSIASVFCASGRVLTLVCDGVRWSTYGPVGCQAVPTAASLVVSSVLPDNSSAADEDTHVEVFHLEYSAAMIGAIIASLVGLQLVLPFICYCCISCCKFDENKLVVEDKHLNKQRLTKFVHACSAFFYFSWWAWFIYLIYYLCAWYRYIPLDGTCVRSAVAIMAIICVCLLYVVVLCESICSGEYEYLTKVKDILVAEEQISRMKKESPSVKFKAECWHPETRTRTIHDGSGQDGNGMHTEMCTVQVHTSAVEEVFSYTGCVDISGNFLLPTCKAAVTQVHIELDIEFADDESKRVFNDAFDLFKTANMGRDQQVDFSVEYDLPSYVKELAIRDSTKRWVSGKYFILATCLCATWPYRWLLNSSKNEYSYRVVKKVSVTPTQHGNKALAGHPILVDISNDGVDSLLVALPPSREPITPPPPYEE